MEIKINDSLIHYEVVNKEARVPVIVLHGWGHSGYVWKNVASLLPNTLCIYLIDLPGFGHSLLGDSVVGLDDFTTLINQFISMRKLRNVTLVGHSFGAQIAVSVAYANTSISHLFLIAPAIKRQRHLVSKTWFYLLGILAKAKKIMPSLWTYHLSSGLNYSQATPRLKLIFRNVIGVDVMNLLPKIKAKTVLVWGERDKEILGSAREIASLIPDARIKVLYDAGHNLHIENPIELSRIVERYIE